MNASNEGQVLEWFERMLDQSADGRRAWLDVQSLPAWLHQRLLGLLQAESTAGGFLEDAAPLPASPEFARVGDRVGNYELLRQLDAGGMGVVFLARRADQAYEQQVAVKLIRPLHFDATPQLQRQLIARFENERALLARMSHPNIARILDGGSTTSGVPYLVMEYVDGASLIEHCDRHVLDVRGRLHLFGKVCDGVQEAHRHLIVHRDLKPDNILVGKDGEPRLLDFGIARALGEAGSDPGGAATALTAMTPAYASPEQVRRQPLTTGSDVYSLGVVLYQLLAGVRPYELAGLSPAQAERMVCDSEPAPLRTALQGAPLPDAERQRRRVQLTPDLERIVAKAMHKDPARRYGSAQALAADVQRFLDGQPVLAHPDSRLYRFGKFVGRHRVGSAAAAAALAVIVSAAGVAFWQARQATHSAQDMQQVNAYLLDVLKMSDPFDSGSELTLSQALDGAAASIDERFADRPDLSAEIRFGIGYSMLSRYRLDAAQTQLTRALRESETAFGPQDIRTLRVLEGIAGLRYEQGHVEEAEALFKRVIARIHDSGQERDPLHVTLLNNLGNLYLMREDYRQADVYLRRALAQSANLKDQAPTDHGNIISNLAQAAHGLEDHARADTLYRQAQRELEALFPKGNPDIAILLNNRALLAEDRNQDRQALGLHQQSLAMRRRVLGDEHPMIVTALANVARLSAELGDKSAALSAAQAAATMADHVYTEPNSRHASVHATLAEARLANGDIAGAARALQRAQSLLATLEPPTPSVVGYLERVRAALCKNPGAPAKVCARTGAGKQAHGIPGVENGPD